MIRIWFALVFILSVLTSYAKGFQVYEWEKERARCKLTPTESEATQLVLKHHVQYDYGFENEQFLMQTIVHRIIYVNNSEAIQKYNRIVVPMRNTLALVDLKARAISKDGKVIYFDKNNLKELKDETTDNSYRIFAMEGVELGSEIEYYYVRKMQANLFERVSMQLDADIKVATFKLTTPKHLEFDFKTYNGIATEKKESTDELNTYLFEEANVPGLKEEPFALLDVNRKRIEFKLAYNKARNNARLYTWDDAAKTFYETVSTLSKDEEKALTKFVGTLKDNRNASTATRIRQVEDVLKSTIVINTESREDGLKELQTVLKSKVASTVGMVRLFYGIYSKLQIPCEIVLTCNRESAKFDGAFDTWNYLDDFQLHFPTTGGFLAPYDDKTRYPLLPAQFMGNKGLFIEPLEIGGIKSGLGTIKDIPAASYLMNTDNLDIRVTFDSDLTKNTIAMKRTFSGYNASFITPYYHLINKEQLNSMVEELTKQTAPDPEIKRWEAKPVGKDSTQKFLIDVDFASSHFLEMAGSKILFKAGLLIGPQSELYQYDKRTLDVENDFNRGYDRSIVIQIPEGYQLKNPEALQFNVTYKDGDETPYLFISNYELKGRELMITIKEYYKQLSAPVSRYEDFRKVINAAADFNKVTLVLEKQK
jgi:hypothetical protein